MRCRACYLSLAMRNRFRLITNVANAAAMIPIRASMDSSGIVGEGLGLRLGVTVEEGLTVADGLALGVEDGLAFVVGVGLPDTPPLTTCTMPHIPNETCPGTGQI